MNPDPYRGIFGNDGEAYAREAQSVIEHSTPGQVAGFCAETIQGVGGTVPLADGYLPAVYKVVLVFKYGTRYHHLQVKRLVSMTGLCI